MVAGELVEMYCSKLYCGGGKEGYTNKQFFGVCW